MNDADETQASAALLELSPYSKYKRDERKQHPPNLLLETRQIFSIRIRSLVEQDNQNLQVISLTYTNNPGIWISISWHGRVLSQFGFGMHCIGLDSGFRHEIVIASRSWAQFETRIGIGIGRRFWFLRGCTSQTQAQRMQHNKTLQYPSMATLKSDYIYVIHKAVVIITMSNETWQLGMTHR